MITAPETAVVREDGWLILTYDERVQCLPAVVQAVRWEEKIVRAAEERTW
jgi:hypothetical protein